MADTISIQSDCIDSQESELLFLTDISRSGTNAALALRDGAGQSSSPNSDVDSTESEPKRRILEPGDIQRRLYLRECNRLHVIPVGAYLRLQGQTTLAIRHYNIGPNGARALSVPLMLDSSLTHLDLEGNDIGYEGVKSLVETLADNVYISNLNLSNNNLRSEGAKMVCSLLLTSNIIESIKLSGKGYTSVQLVDPDLRHGVCFRCCIIFIIGTTADIEALVPRVVGGNDFHDADAEIFAKVMKETRTLKELSLAHNGFGEIAGTEFGNAIAVNESLETLDLSWNHIRRRSAAAFALGIKENVRLKTLDVSFNGFGAEGAAVIALALNTNRTLVELNLAHNRLIDEALKFVATQLPSNDTLKILRIGENPITTVGALELLEAIKEAESCAIEVLDMEGISVDRTFIKTLKAAQKTKNLSVVHGKVQKLPVDKLPPRKVVPVPENGDAGTTEIDNAGDNKEDHKKEPEESESKKVDTGNDKHKKNEKEVENMSRDTTQNPETERPEMETVLRTGESEEPSHEIATELETGPDISKNTHVETDIIEQVETGTPENIPEESCDVDKKSSNVTDDNEENNEPEVAETVEIVVNDTQETESQTDNKSKITSDMNITPGIKVTPDVNITPDIIVTPDSIVTPDINAEET
ncbi:hypothetical protein ScPMuIL_014103 [Solemya velum]